MLKFKASLSLVCAIFALTFLMTTDLSGQCQPILPGCNGFEVNEDPVVSCGTPGANLLANNSFEAGFASWSPFGNFFPEQMPGPGVCDASPAQDGTGVVKAFGNFAGFFGVGGLFQDVPAKPGDVFNGSIWVYNQSCDAIGADNFIEIHIEFQNVAGCFATPTDNFVTSVQITTAFPQNVWTEVTFSGVAPENTNIARFVILHFQPCDFAVPGGCDGGAVLFDNASLSIECCADAGTQSADVSDLCLDAGTTAPAAGTTVEVCSAGGAYPGFSNYAWIITEAGVITDVLPSTNYNAAAPVDFCDDLDISALPIGEYCIHGINYLDGADPCNAGISGTTTLAILQTFIGLDATAVAPALAELDGAPNGGTICADLNFAGCSTITIAATPELTSQSGNAFLCQGGSGTVSATGSIADMSDLTFTLYRADAVLGSVVVSTQTFTAPTAVETADFTIAALGECTTYFVELSGSSDACIVESDPIISMTNVESNSLACNNTVTVSLDTGCEPNWNVISYLEGEGQNQCGIQSLDFYNALYEVVIIGLDGTELREGDDLSTLIGECLKYEVRDICFGGVCWGEICFEDKLPPSFDACGCPEGGFTGIGGSAADYSDACRLKCYQINDLRNGIEGNVGNCDYLVAPPMVSDNCDQNGVVSFNDIVEPFIDPITGEEACGVWKYKRNFSLTYQRFNEAAGVMETVVADECTYEWWVDSYVGTDTVGLLTDGYGEVGNVTIEQIGLPVAYIEVACGFDPTPANLVARFDLPGNPGPSGDSPNTPSVIENNEGIAWGYPFYFAKGFQCGFHPQPINTEICNINVTYSDTDLDSCGDECFGNQKTLRTWTLLDWCTLETVEWTQLIKAVDMDGPTIAADDITVSVDPWGCIVDAQLPAPFLLHDDCDAKLVTYTVSSVAGVTVSGDMENGFVAEGLQKTMPNEPYQFLYTAEDCCGNQSAISVISVTVIDVTPPVAVTKQNITIALSAVMDLTGEAKIFADDLDNGSYDECGGVHLEIRRVGDNCGINGNTTYNNNGDPDDDKDDPDGGQYVKFCCDDLEDDGNGGMAGIIDVELRVWDDANMNGIFGDVVNGLKDNYNTSWATITVEDKGGGSQQCPDNLILTCDMEPSDLNMTGVPTAQSTCMEIPCDSIFMDVYSTKRPTDAPELNDPLAALGYGPTIPPFDPVCREGAIRRTICGCTQWLIFVTDGVLFDPNSISYPEDQIVECMDFEAEVPTWTEVACQLIGYTVDPDTFNFEDGACFKVLNNYDVINWCDYNPADADLNDIDEPIDPLNPFDPNTMDDGVIPGLWSWTQVIKLIDTDDPTLEMTTDSCFAVNIDCVSDAIKISAVGDDNGDCASEWLKWDVAVDLWSDWTADYTYTSFTTANDPSYVAATARGEMMMVELPAGVEVSKVPHRVIITVSDGCGNVSSETFYIEITDKKKPTPYCLNLSTAVMAGDPGTVELWAIDFNQNSFDNCSAEEVLLFTFSDVPPPPRDDAVYAGQDWYDGSYWFYDRVTGDYAFALSPTADRWVPGLRTAGRMFTAADIPADPNESILLPMYVWDECGNNDFCNVNLRLIDNQSGSRAEIAGDIRTEDGRNINDVEVSLSSDALTTLTDMTDAQGSYTFIDNPMYQDYTLSGSRDIDYLNGVSTLDLVLIQRHVLGLQALNSGYKMIAADINNDENISSIDLIELRKLILGIYEELPENDSWRFLPSSQTMGANPWPFSEVIDILDLDQDEMDEDYVGVKIGDVNSTVSLNLSGGTVDSRNAKTLNFNIVDQSYTTGEMIELSFTSENFNEVSGYQFSLQSNGLELADVVSGALNVSTSNFAMVDGMITTSWNSESPVSAEGVLFTMYLRATTAGSTSSMEITSAITKAEAYYGNGYELANVSLRGDDPTAEYALDQNEPNPFENTTMIGFTLPSAAQATLTVYDVTGKVLSVKEGSYESGYNQIVLTKEDVPTAGVMYYKLESGDFSETKKMIMIK